MPHLGIFWRVPHAGALVLLTDGVPLAEAEPYGDRLTHPRGHAGIWEAWRGLAGRERRRLGVPDVVLWERYDAVPRGRVVADRAGDRFTIYADRKLHLPPWPTRIVQAFDLDPARCAMEVDAHYRTRGG